MFGVAACAAPGDGGAASLAGTRWVGMVEKANDASAPRLEFVTEGRVSGYTGCNMLSGTWRQEGNDVRFGAIVTTKRGCLGPAGDYEKRLLAAMGENSRARREAGRLVLEGPGGARFEFTEAR